MGVAPAMLSPQETEPEDRSILQTMGEMCLAEEMFEEAKQVFERLTRADPGHELYWELLNRARGGLGLSPLFASAAKPPAVPPLPAQETGTAGPGTPVAPLFEAAQPSLPLSPPPLKPLATVPSSLPPLKPLAVTPQAPPPVPAAAAPSAPLPQAAPKARVAGAEPLPVAKITTPDGSHIERTQYVIQLGELPPAVASDVDDADEIIE